MKFHDLYYMVITWNVIISILDCKGKLNFLLWLEILITKNHLRYCYQKEYLETEYLIIQNMFF